MKRYLAAILLLSVMLSGCGLLNRQQDQTISPVTPETDPEPTINTVALETYYVVNCEEGISMYTSADVSSAELCRIPLGAGVSYIQTEANGFYKITYQGLTGYAFAENLSATAPQVVEKYVTYYVVNCNEYITLRTQPDVSADAVCRVPLGSSVSYISTADNGYYKVNYNGETGYALASYLSQDPKAHSKPQENTGSLSGGIYATCYVVNCRQSITLRTSPNTSAGEYCQIPLGAAVSYISASSNGFYKVIYNGQVGYALASYLSFTKPSGGHYDYVYYLQVVNCQRSITLRTAPNTMAGEYCQIPLGSYVEYLGSAENGFYLVAYNGYVGYALASYLSW